MCCACMARWLQTDSVSMWEHLMVKDLGLRTPEALFQNIRAFFEADS